MRFFLKAALLAGLSLNFLVASAQAGPFGLFTRSMFSKSCIYCNCEKPYNAFTPMGYNPLIHRPVAAASAPIMGSHMIGNGTLQSSGCSSCGLQPIIIGPLQPIPADPIIMPYPH